MNQEKTTLEVIAPTVEEAVEKGLTQLNLRQDAVDVEVLDAGSRGLFGIGSRQARVRLTVKTSDAPAVRQSMPRPMPAPVVRPTPPVRPARVPEPEEEPEPELDDEEEFIPDTVETPIDEDETLRVAREVITDLVEKMKVRAKVTASYRPPEDENDEEVVLVNVQGNDLSILIGRRTETLNALQYIGSLIICKRLDHWIPLVIDVQGYRARRERQLRQLAQRMAEQAIHTGRLQVLEPMPANERRLIHLELRNHPNVETSSIGEEPNRKVTVSLKQ